MRWSPVPLADGGGGARGPGMFDEVVRTVGDRRAARRASWVGVSTVAQVLLAIGVVAFYRARALPPARAGPVVEVTFFRGAPRSALPPAPQPAPVPRKKPPREASREPLPVPALVQPKEVPAEAKPSDPDQAHPPDDPSWDDGVVGGVVGGATDGAAAMPPEPREFDASSMARPIFVSGPDLAYTRRALDRDVEGLMIVRCVVTVEGTVRDCRVVKGLPYMDESVVQALERRRYRPATLGGTPVEVKYVFRINLTLPRQAR